VTQHQANHNRIQLLRQTAETLDNQIKSTITTLAETRKELLNTPFTTFPDSSHAVSVDELLSYAKRIAPFTVPPTSFQAPVAAGKASQKPAESHNDAAMTMANDMDGTTPTVAAGQNTGSQTQTPAGGGQQQQDAGFASQLSGNLQLSLGQQAQPQFVPWPDENRMVASALMDVKAQIERGEDPATKNLAPEELARVEEERRKKEEEEESWRRQEEEERQKVESYRPVGVGNKGEHVGGAIVGTRARQEFMGFGLYDPGEEEE